MRYGFQQRKNKFNSKITFKDGYHFDSMAECSLYDYIKAQEQAGEWRLIQTQASVYLTDARILYKPDFLIEDLSINEEVYLEMKGFETPVWRIKRRLWPYYGIGTLRVYKTNRLGVYMHEELRAKNK